MHDDFCYFRTGRHSDCYEVVVVCFFFDWISIYIENGLISSEV